MLEEALQLALKAQEKVWILEFWKVKSKKHEFQMKDVAKQNTLPETNSSHLKIGHPKRKLVFQPSISRVSEWFVFSP